MNDRSDTQVMEPPPRVMRRSQAIRRSEAEAAILQAAADILAERGLERLTLADVGEAAGYSRGLPAHYFGSKEGLTAALARHIVRGFGHHLLHTEKHPPGLARLLGTVALYLDSTAKSPTGTRALFVVLGEALTDEGLRKEIAVLNARSVTSLADDIKAGVVAGEIRKGLNAKSEASLILGGLRGIAALWLNDPERIDLKALRNAFVAGLKRSLAP